MTKLSSGYLCCFFVVLQITSSALIAKHVETHTRNDVIGESDHVDGGGGVNHRNCLCVCLMTGENTPLSAL